MLPPLIPLSAAPITAQQDPVKPTPDIPAVAPVQPSSSDSTINMGERDPEQAQLLLREEQRRQQRRRRDRRTADRHPDLDESVEADARESLQQGAYAGPAIPGDFLNADNTVPVVPIIDDEPRQGLWVDLKV
ncbi:MULTISPECIES: aspartate-semialdehyde dehydrogenase [unclassified Pseudomonas]|uniref:aspartate-semialdehyde dehydrogenase n=1 Tax=unclassified Pseudomonas TaxID=196821 RepID=UPI0025CDA7F0|nr:MULTISPECIES: aspartate-semialdehyde dehydrogenase [unclassified Pseudomonas]